MIRLKRSWLIIGAAFPNLKGQYVDRPNQPIITCECNEPIGPKSITLKIMKSLL